MSKVGIVIVNYNDFRKTWDFIDSIKDYRSLSEIVVVDNGSTDSSFKELKKLGKNNITVLRSNENKGYSFGNNIGIKYLSDKVDYILISNPDVVVEERIIKKLKEDLDNNPDVALVAPIVEQNGELLKGWRLPKVKDEIKLNLIKYYGSFEKPLRYDEKRYSDELTRVDAVLGCFFMIRRDVFNLVGNFDDSVFLFYEENILATKLKRINKKSYIDNKTKIIHKGSTTINKHFTEIEKYKMLKDSQKYYVKYYLHANVFQIFVLRFIYRITLIITYIVNFFKKKK